MKKIWSERDKVREKMKGRQTERKWKNKSKSRGRKKDYKRVKVRMQFLGKCYKAKQLEREIKRFTKKKCVWKLRERDKERER